MTYDKILSVFREILRIPRESGHEELIIAYLKDFAETRSLPCQTDKAGNVLITVPATEGMEDAPIVILQSHTDMVCEKNEGAVHDFSKDAIKAVIEDGWIIAKETTLGADCGIGIATTLALIDDKEAVHGPLECLFTSSEETGMDGAFGLEKSFLKGKTLINLDSEDEGELFIGCAGGIDTTAKFHYSPKTVNRDNVIYKLSLFGGLGGHSGDDIHKNRSCAVKLLARILYRIMKETDTELCFIDGGNKRNAIARESCAIIGFSQ
ncbi:MAG: M20/M25/M40 family metallo-hydrolase, partial [Alistipes sp.]|nr:M20/M25/M40 family metallo-hydrolase [Candidatus Minthomonas equi]